MRFMFSHINRQAKPHHPASIKMKLVKKKASASATVTRADLMSMDSFDEEGEVGAPPSDTIDLPPADGPPADTAQGQPPPKKTRRQAADEVLKKVQSQQQNTGDKLAEMMERVDAADCPHRTWGTWMTTQMQIPDHCWWQYMKESFIQLMHYTGGGGGQHNWGWQPQR